MYTQCTHCEQIFRVTAESLTKAKGYVRCGTCRTPFHAASHLMDAIKMPPPPIQRIVKQVKKQYPKLLKAKVLFAVTAVAVATPVDNPHVYVPSVQNPLRGEIVRTKAGTKMVMAHSAPPREDVKVQTVSLVESVREPSLLEEDVVDSPEQPIVTFDTRDPQTLLEEARTNLLSRNGPYDVAMNDLRSIIGTVPPEQARLAHEFLGYAYEKSKKYKKAQKEYELYLSLYPDDNEDRVRVRQRLMAIEIMVPHEMFDLSKDRKPRHGENKEFSATLSEYLFTDFHQINSLTGVQFSFNIQHNEFNLSSRVRLSKVENLTNSAGNRTNLSAAYLDLEDTYRSYGVRVGKQPSVAGAMSRFDGISARYDVSPSVRIEAATGVPFAGSNVTTARRFEGLEVGWSINSAWRLNSYYNRGTADGILERSAFGNILNYFHNNYNFTFRTEYDILYSSLNLVSFQGMKMIGPYDYFALYERRKAPFPYADVGLGLGILNQNRQLSYDTVSELFNKSGIPSSEIYRYIGNTPVATTAVIGANKRLSKDWSATVDLQMTNLSTVSSFNVSPQYDPVPVQLGQSNSYSVNFHLRGENVWKANNSTEFVVNESTGQVSGQYFTFADSYRFGDRGRDNISAIVRYDHFRRQNDDVQAFTGIFRGLHAMNDHGVLEVQYSKAFNSAKDQSLYIGYRYDF